MWNSQTRDEEGFHSWIRDEFVYAIYFLFICFICLLCEVCRQEAKMKDGHTLAPQKKDS